MISAKITSPGLTRFARRLRAGQNDALRMAARAAQAQAAVAVEEVRARTPVRTGHLRDTVQAVRVGGAVSTYLVQITAPYARFVEEDTAAHVIRPRRAQVLRFSAGGRVVFARWARHPGTRGAHMLALGTRAAAKRTIRVVAGYLAAHTRSLARG